MIINEVFENQQQNITDLECYNCGVPLIAMPHNDYNPIPATMEPILCPSCSSDVATLVWYIQVQSEARIAEARATLAEPESFKPVVQAHLSMTRESLIDIIEKAHGVTGIQTLTLYGKKVGIDVYDNQGPKHTKQ